MLARLGACLLARLLVASRDAAAAPACMPCPCVSCGRVGGGEYHTREGAWTSPYNQPTNQPTQPTSCAWNLCEGCVAADALGSRRLPPTKGVWGMLSCCCADVAHPLPTNQPTNIHCGTTPTTESWSMPGRSAACVLLYRCPACRGRQVHAAHLLYCLPPGCCLLGCPMRGVDRVDCVWGAAVCLLGCPFWGVPPSVCVWSRGVGARRFGWSKVVKGTARTSDQRRLCVHNTVVRSTLGWVNPTHLYLSPGWLGMEGAKCTLCLLHCPQYHHGLEQLLVWQACLSVSPHLARWPLVLLAGRVVLGCTACGGVQYRKRV